MYIKNISENKKKTAGAGVATTAALVMLSGFVPAINLAHAASPIATANVGVSVVIQQAINITAGNKVNFGTIILSRVTIAGTIGMNDTGNIVTTGLTTEVSHIGGQGVGTFKINPSAGQINIGLGPAPTDDGGNIIYPKLKFGGVGLPATVIIYASANAILTLIASTISIGSYAKIIHKPTPGDYASKFYNITITDV